MFLRKLDKCLSSKAALGCIFGLALAVAVTAGAALYKGRQAIETSCICSGMSSLILSLVLILTLLLLAFALAWKISACKAALDKFTTHCNNTEIDSLTAPYTPEYNCAALAAVFAAHNAMFKRLHNSTSRIRQFSGDASHELRTPLTIMRGETEVALRWGKTAEDYHNTLVSNMEEIERMGRIIEDLLTLAKSESGELPLSISHLSLSDLLQEMYIQARKLAAEKNIEVHLQHEVDKEIWLNGDDLRLRQLFWNILSNALRYTPEHGSVGIELKCTENSAIVSISDTGIGIEPEHIEHIFERFYRTDAARNRTDGGTGLGLAIAKWIVESHHGSIHVKSTIDGGSTFEVTLPLIWAETPILSPTQP
ncbi:MAG: ATP-binding protein [Desulfuromonadaceae bacterium]|nr:ATP-binding protein [Desulfuromonas sp.]MDY0185404.1 ATP-binding protein [Desulfuromonadaceae bacterium]